MPPPVPPPPPPAAPVTPTSLASPLGRWQGRAPSPAALALLARRAWRERGLALIDPSRLACPVERALVLAIAGRLHGPRP